MLTEMGGDNSKRNLYDDIVEKLTSNGGLTEKQRRDFTVMALVDIGRKIDQLGDIARRVENLEKHSILLLAVKNLKYTIPIMLFAIVLTVSVVLHLELWQWVFDLLGIPVPTPGP